MGSYSPQVTLGFLWNVNVHIQRLAFDLRFQHIDGFSRLHVQLAVMVNLYILGGREMANHIVGATPLQS